MDPDPELQAKIRRFEEHWADEPDSPVFARLADLHRRAGSPGRSLEILERGLDRHPGHVTGHLVRGRVYVELGEEERAEEAFRRALELDEENLVALRSLGELARRRGARQEAVRRFRRVVELDPDDEEARRRLDRLREGGRPGAGADDADGEAGRDEEEEFATPTLAKLYADQGFYEEAVEMYRDLLRQRPDDPTLLARLRAVRAAMGGGDEAADRQEGEPPTDGDDAPAPARPDTGDGSAAERGSSPAGGRPAPESDVGGWRQAVGAVEAPPPTIRQHLRELLRGEAVPGLVNRSLPPELRPGGGGRP